MTTDPIVSQNPTAVGTPQTYEDAIAVIEASKDEKDATNLRAVITQLHGFFKTRVGKRKAEGDRDGGNAVKAALASSRKFEPFTPRSIGGTGAKP